MPRPRKPFHAVRFDGAIYDTGSKIGFLLANVAYGLERDELAPALKAGIAQARLGRRTAARSASGGGARRICTSSTV